MVNLIQKIDKFSCRYWALCIILIIPFSMYSLGISTITLTEWLLLFGLLLFFWEKRGKISFGYDVSLFLEAMFFFYLLSVISHIIQIVDMQTVFIIRHFRLAMLVCFMIAAYNIIDKSMLLKYLRNITIIAAVYVIIQYIFYRVAGIYLPNELLPLPVIRETGEEAIFLLEQYYFRAYGFFTEPSYFAKFCIPGFAYCLYGWEKRQFDYWGLLLISVAIFLSTSLQGIVLVFFMFGFWSIKTLRSNGIQISKIVKEVIAILLLSVVLIVVFSGHQASDYIFRRLDNLFNFNIIAGSSYSYRLLRGYFVFDQLPWYFQIFGIGFGGLAEYILANNIYTPVDVSIYGSATAAGYVNGISLILISCGVIGFFIFSYCFCKIYKYSNNVNRVILLTYMLSLFSGGGVFNIFMIYILSIVFIGNKH